MDVHLAGGGYVDDAADALSQTNVYVSPEVGGGEALGGRLQTQIGDASIGVAVFSDNARLEASGPDIVAELIATTDYETIVVAVGDDLSAGSTVLDAGEAMRIANEAEFSAGNVDAALTETVQSILVESEPGPAPSPGGSGGLLIGLAVGAVVVVAGAGALLSVVLGRRRRARARAAEGAPEVVQAHVATLRALSGEYARVGASGNPTASQTATDLANIAENTDQLFARLSRKGVEDQRTLAEVEYGDKLGKLVAAVDRDYLLDLLTHPQLWDDPQERIIEVREAVVAVSTQLIDNIKQVNARRSLHFQISLDSLIGARKELQDWDREFRDAENS